MQNDLISRSALITEHCDGCDAFTKGLCDHDVCGAAQLIMETPAVDAVEVGSCDGCYWKEIGRQQKCSCCRRNRYLKDCYQREKINDT